MEDATRAAAKAMLEKLEDLGDPKVVMLALHYGDVEGLPMPPMHEEVEDAERVEDAKRPKPKAKQFGKTLDDEPKDSDSVPPESPGEIPDEENRKSKP